VAKTYQLIDTSFLYALYNQSDSAHSVSLELAKASTATPLVPVVILPEVSFLFLRDVGYHGMLRFVKGFAKSETTLVNLTASDLARAGEIAQSYETVAFDFVDCCVMAIAERLKVTQVCTYDHRDFSIFRPSHCKYLELLP
jgi:hypothetical protein